MSSKEMSSVEQAEATEQAALSVIEMENLTVEAKVKQVELERLRREKREKLIAKTYRVLGQIQTSDMIQKFAHVSSLVWLKQVKESQIYTDIPDVETWEKFCKHLGYSRQHVDRQILNLKSLGEEFLNTVSSLGVGYREIQKLRWAVDEGRIVVENGFVKIGDKEIPLSPDHIEDLQVGIEYILEEMAVKEAELKKFKKNVANIQNEEIKGLKIERGLLINENKRLKAFDPEGKSPSLWSLEQAEEIKNAAIQFRHLCGRFIVDGRIEEDLHVQALCQAAITEARMALRELQTQWDLAFNSYDEIP